MVFLPEEIRDRVIASSVTEENISEIYTHFPDTFFYSEHFRVYWDRVCMDFSLSENFLRRFHKLISFEILTKYQVLSESFLLDFKDRFDWNYVSFYQELSRDFILKNRTLLDWDYVVWKYSDYKLNEII
jgi:hypothetical protein